MKFNYHDQKEESAFRWFLLEVFGKHISPTLDKDASKDKKSITVFDVEIKVNGHDIDVKWLFGSFDEAIKRNKENSFESGVKYGKDEAIESLSRLIKGDDYD